MNNYNLIGIAGIKRSGKDTIAEYLIEKHGYVRYAFADPIKRGVIEMFGFTEAQMWGSTEDKETVDERWGISPRRILQLLGTELLQFDIHSHLNGDEFPVGRNIWVLRFKIWYQDELKKNPNLRVVISDVRFLHEVAIINELGGVICKIERPGLPKAETHLSEAEVEKIIGDVYIQNNSTLEELYKNIEINLVEPNKTPYLCGTKESVIDILKRILLVEEDSFGDLEIDIFKLGEVVINWPLCKDEDGFEEELDLENWHIFSLTSDRMVMSGGGDWQDGVMFTLIPENGMLRAIDITSDYDWSDELSFEEIIEILTK